MMSVVYKRDMGTAESTESGILKMLVYFSIFQYPLSKDEIRSFLHPGANIASFDSALDRLIDKGCIFKIDELYSLQNDISSVKKRREGNARAEKLLPKAMKIGKFLFRFPYVRGIAISGSLSKMYADEKADIDFFIITKADRLWIARTCMHLFKKFTYLTGKQHFYCMNYYIDEKALKLDDQSVYTAIETMTLLPVCGESMQDFIAANNWVNEWFANYSLKQKNPYHHPGGSWIKNAIERIFNNKAGNWLDNYLIKVTTRRWQKKKRHGMLNYQGRTMDLVTGKHFARSNPGMFRERILEMYDAKINEMKTRWPQYFRPVSFSFEE